MLIQKSIKLFRLACLYAKKFESFVNSEEYQTSGVKGVSYNQFESFVNSEEYQTTTFFIIHRTQFESFVNSEEYQTQSKTACEPV